MQIDYLYGRRVEAVEEGTSDDVAWCIVLEGDARITVLDHGYGIPDAPTLEGLALTAFDRYRGSVRLFFGTNENPRGTVVNLPPGRYRISDPTYTQGEAVDPEAAAEPHVIPPDPEEERRRNAAEEPKEDGADSVMVDG